MSYNVQPRLWVAGGRDYADREAIKRALIDYHSYVLVTGAARGTDLIAHRSTPMLDVRSR